MDDEVMLEVAVKTTDTIVVDEIQSALSEVSPQRWPQDRDPFTILAIAANAGTIISALLDLKDRLSKRSEPAPQIVIRNVERFELTLPDATEETLHQLIDAGKPPAT
jgi:predicted component of type VI protein secretion system